MTTIDGVETLEEAHDRPGKSNEVYLYQVEGDKVRRARECWRRGYKLLHFSSFGSASTGSRAAVST